MINETEINTIKKITETLLEKMTVTDYSVDVGMGTPRAVTDINISLIEGGSIDITIELKEPQMVIGSSGQTLFEIQHILKLLLRKIIPNPFYLNIDINGYKKKKSEYLKNMAREIADEVTLTKQKKALPPMPSYERRIIHLALIERQDVVAKSEGEGLDRYMVINPK